MVAVERGRRGQTGTLSSKLGTTSSCRDAFPPLAEHNYPAATAATLESTDCTSLDLNLAKARFPDTQQAFEYERLFGDYSKDMQILGSCPLRNLRPVLMPYHQLARVTSSAGFRSL